MKKSQSELREKVGEPVSTELGNLEVKGIDFLNLSLWVGVSTTLLIYSKSTLCGHELFTLYAVGAGRLNGPYSSQGIPTLEKRNKDLH